VHPSWGAERRIADEGAAMIEARHAVLPDEATKALDIEGYVAFWSPES
jgi:hypothetical protein